MTTSSSPITGIPSTGIPGTSAAAETVRPGEPGRTKPIGVGIVGLSAGGGWAARAHVPALAAVDDFRLVGLAASSKESAAAAAQKFDVPVALTDPGELAAHPDVDLVVVSVRVPRHRELIVPALESGTPVLSEWPLGNGLLEAEELAALAERQGVRTAVGLQARSAPVVRYLRDLVAGGYVGDVLSTSLVASGGLGGPELESRNAYTADRANGATLLTIPFGHTVDALTMVLSGFAELSATTATRRTEVRITDTGERVPQSAEDQVAVSGVLESGAVASVHYRGGVSRGTNLLWEINGTEGDLRITGDLGHLQFGEVTVHGAQGDQPLAELSIPESYQRGPGASRVSGPISVLAHAYTELAADLRDGTDTVPDFTHAVRHHRLLERISESAASGTRR